MHGARFRIARATGAASLCAVLAQGAGAAAAASPVRILAAESVYGEVAGEIAGTRACVTSVLSSPAQNPHDFEARPSTAREAAEAAVVVVNGAGYDPWMDRLLAAADVPGREVIRVARLAQAAPGANPHLWYDPVAMPRFAEALTAALLRQDAGGAGLYQINLKKFLGNAAGLQARIDALRAKFAGAPITATEPVFNDMALALGLRMRNERYQLAVMNGTEPRVSDVAAMDADLRQHRVRVLLSNPQVTSPATARLLGLARQYGVPVVLVTETLPPGQTYTGWMLAQLAALERALGGP
jgi:zinc/manganese transport system substrate-binding protein